MSVRVRVCVSACCTAQMLRNAGTMLVHGGERGQQDPQLAVLQRLPNTIQRQLQYAADRKQ
jgi:hypothetical protein